MKRVLIHRLSILVAMVALMVSCTKKSSEYTSVIPANASAVVSIHIQSLIDKSGVSDADKQKLIDLMKTELSAATFQHVEKIIKDASASGLSTKDPMYLFTTETLSSPAIVIRITDLDKLYKTFEVMATENIAEPISRSNGVDMVKLKGKGMCAFNESSLLIVEGNHTEKVIADFMKQSADESITGNHYYQSMMKKKGDISFFFGMDAMPNMYKRQMATAYNPNEVDLKNIIVAGWLNFEKGKVALQTEMLSEDEKVKAMFKKQQEFLGKLNETFLSNFPLSTLMYASFNIDGEKLYNMLQDDKNFRESLSLDQAEKIRDVFNSFKGDISIGLINVTMTDMPTFAAYAEAKDGVALETLYNSKADLGLARNEDIIKLGKNQYVYKSNKMNFFFGYKDKYIYITNNELINKNIGRKESQSLKDAVYASSMKGKNQYVVIDMKSILDLPAVKMLSAMGGREAATYIDMASKVSYLEMIGSDNHQSEVNLWLVDKNTNSLKQIVDLAKQYAGI